MPHDHECGVNHGVGAVALHRSRRRASSVQNLPSELQSSLAAAATLAKRNSCQCRKCSIFNLEDCEPKEVSSVIKYLKFRKVQLI
jgi:hypothetical protein